MELIFIRHAIAVDRSDPQVSSDAERWLTEKGIERMKQAAEGLACFEPELNAIYTSTYVRAKETAEIVHKAYNARPPLNETDLLCPGAAFDALPELLKQHAPSDKIALVGHEPDFSEMIAELISGSQRASVEMKKGAVACVDIGSQAYKGMGTLLYLLPPKLLREL